MTILNTHEFPLTPTPVDLWTAGLTGAGVHPLTGEKHTSKQLHRKTGM
jgi:hypothetical protein